MNNTAINKNLFSVTLILLLFIAGCVPFFSSKNNMFSRVSSNITLNIINNNWNVDTVSLHCNSGVRVRSIRNVIYNSTRTLKISKNICDQNNIYMMIENRFITNIVNIGGNISNVTLYIHPNVSNSYLHPEQQ